jgi:hypothetical protein
MQSVITADGVVVKTGDRVFNYYDVEWGKIGGIERDGWFTFWPEGKSHGRLLNGERVVRLRRRPRDAAGHFLPSPEPTKRWYHQQAQAFLKDRCQGIKPNGSPCRSRTRLQAHHVDLNVTHNTDDNVATLCDRCHIRAHGRRTWPQNNRRLRRLRLDVAERVACH